MNPTPAARTGMVELDVPVPDIPLDIPLLGSRSLDDPGDSDDPADVASARIGVRLPDGTLVEAQVVGLNDRLLSDEQVDAGALAGLFRRVHDRELFGQQITRIDLDPAARALTFHVATDAGAALRRRRRTAESRSRGRRQPGRLAGEDAGRGSVPRGRDGAAPLGWTAMALKLPLAPESSVSSPNDRVEVTA